MSMFFTKMQRQTRYVATGHVVFETHFPYASLQAVEKFVNALLIYFNEDKKEILKKITANAQLTLLAREIELSEPKLTREAFLNKMQEAISDTVGAMHRIRMGDLEQLRSRYDHAIGRLNAKADILKVQITVLRTDLVDANLFHKVRLHNRIAALEHELEMIVSENKAFTEQFSEYVHEVENSI